MATLKEQLKLHYDQRGNLITEIKIMRKELQTEQKLTTRFRKQRDKFKVERQSLLEKTTPEIESRDSQKDLLEKLNKARNILFQTRATEPAMRNGLNYIINKLRREKESLSMNKILELISRFKEEYKSMMVNSKKKLLKSEHEEFLM